MAWRTWIAAPVALAVIGIGITAGTASATDHTAPPNSKAFGKSLADWTSAYFVPGFSGSPIDTIKKVKLLPLPAGTQVGGDFTSSNPATVVGALDVTLKPGTPFVLPVAIWFGEKYSTPPGLPDDAPLNASVFTGSNVLVKVDGVAVIDSHKGDLARWYVAPQYYDPPITYPAPTSYGSIAANFVQGLAFVHHPLSKGDHTLTLKSEIITFVPNYYGPGLNLDIGVRYENSWTIHVTK
jgi:hypothetical protein